jgi:hypothetical protein
LSVLGTAANSQVWINEIVTNPNGSDSGAAFGNEHFELRGTPSLALAGYYLLGIEGQGTTGRGDINQFFDLGAFSLGANGYLFARQNFSPYVTTTVGATVAQNTSGQGWGLTGASTVGHSGDGTQVDLENSATTILLINRGSGSAPLLTLDLDANDDGQLELPSGWSVVDSIGIMDGATPLATDFSYASVTLRVGGLGTSAAGNIIDVPGTPPTSAGAIWVGRIGESTGSTADDWVGGILNGAQADALNITLASASDERFVGQKLSDMSFGGPNPIPEPGTLSLLGLAGVALFWRRRR